MPLEVARLTFVAPRTDSTLQDEDEEQGTLKFGKQKEQASYGGMDEEDKAIWKVLAQFLVLSAFLRRGSIRSLPSRLSLIWPTERNESGGGRRKNAFHCFGGRKLRDESLSLSLNGS